MKLKTIILSAALSLPCLGQQATLTETDREILANTKHPVHPCLWEVTGKDLKKPSYLFGTCHVSDPRITTLHPDAQKAFDGSDAVYGEIKFAPSDATKLAQLMVRQDGKTVTEDIGEERAARVDQVLKGINPALSLKAGLDGMHTWAVSITLMTLEEQMKGGKVLDTELLSRAEEAGKSTAGLETVESQIGALTSISDSHSLLMLDSTLEYMEKEGAENPLDAIKDIYILKNPDEIGKYMNDYLTYRPDGKEMSAEEKEMSEWFISELLDKRNVNMATTINELLEGKSGHSHFFAIGAGHYTGETAIQDLLENKGYTITPKF